MIFVFFDHVFPLRLRAPSVSLQFKRIVCLVCVLHLIQIWHFVWVAETWPLTLLAIAIHGVILGSGFFLFDKPIKPLMVFFLLMQSLSTCVYLGEGLLSIPYLIMISFLFLQCISLGRMTLYLLKQRESPNLDSGSLDKGTVS